ncbi:Cytosolic Fe-S cluster assembly factor nar1 [Elasticomyces elasticus]|nr:Cytosolic Fe-S cluster assembly factor nar1 [Elasticomyces elasticus]KAK4918321.1 Cytosolic Fe-S cluster assembly factor nar1 [Elasticomyces elasticus]KAK5762729.1 Cytosolic Fe-S cluster assembly factor nar1 [Elasticomyces elasticus]
MSAILSADDLNDFINPGIACIKPVETLPKQQPVQNGNPYEVTTEEQVQAEQPPPPAQISLTDCLACSGCVTSAEAVLVSLQSHSEVLDTLDAHKELQLPQYKQEIHGMTNGDTEGGKIFVASVSPQTRASLAATYGVSEREAGNMISQLLSGPYGLREGGKHGSGFTWVIDTNVMRDVALVSAADEAQQALDTPSGELKKPVLTSACPGWICYAEKTHPHILPHLSKLKSPQALTGTLIKSVLAKKCGVSPNQIWHLAVMPCFDKKLEASRRELTSHTWHGEEGDAIRDVDCVITARELLMLAESRNISFPCMPRTPVSKQYAPAFPDPAINRFLFGRRKSAGRQREEANNEIGTSGGYLYHVLKTQQAKHPGSSLRIQRGRNADVSDYAIVSSDGTEVFKAARYYGFRNIQNLVRRLKPAKASRMPGAARRPGGARKPGGAAAGEGDYAYVEVMACPGGCTNGGGQVKVGDVATLRQVGGTGIENGSVEQDVLPAQREWLTKVDEAYWSASDSGELDELADDDGDISVENGSNADGQTGIGPDADVVDGIDRRRVKDLLDHWVAVTGVDLDKLLCTTYRAVESDVGKSKGEASEMEKVSALAVAAGGGW